MGEDVGKVSLIGLPCIGSCMDMLDVWIWWIQELLLV